MDRDRRMHIVMGLDPTDEALAYGMAEEGGPMTCHDLVAALYWERKLREQGYRTTVRTAASTTDVVEVGEVRVLGTPRDVWTAPVYVQRLPVSLWEELRLLGAEKGYESLRSAAAQAARAGGLLVPLLVPRERYLALLDLPRTETRLREYEWGLGSPES